MRNGPHDSGKVSLEICVRRDSTERTFYFFLPACLAATAALFFWLALLALVCFWWDFFWLDFGDLSPIILTFFCVLTHLRHVSFSEGIVIVLARWVNVNDKRGFDGVSAESGKHGRNHSSMTICYSPSLFQSGDLTSAPIYGTTAWLSRFLS